MIQRDRVLRSTTENAPAPARKAQDILNDLWRAEEANAHKFHRTDRKWGSNTSYEQLAESGAQFASPTEPLEAIISHRIEAKAMAALLHLLTAARQRLTPRQQEIICLIYEHDLSQADVARRLKISRAAVSKNHQKALSALRAELASAAIAKLSEQPSPLGPEAAATQDGPTH